MITLDIPALIDESKKKKIKIYPCHTNRASNAGQECARRLVYERTAWDKKLLHDVGLQYIFDEGNRSERATVEDITEAGLTLVEGQRPFSWPDLQVTGSIDGKIAEGQRRIPIEAKSINPYDFQTIRDFASVATHKKAHIRGYLAQLMMYLIMDNQEEGILLFRDKNSGRYKQINVAIDYTFLESILKKFELVNEHVKNKTLPDRVEDLTLCKNCPFRAECLPDTSFGEGAQIVTDDYLIQLIERRASLSDLTSEHGELDEEIKSLSKKRAGDKPGLFVVNGTWEVNVKTHGKGLRVDVSKLGQLKEEAAA
jgi:CRISPR/Cas system-associated exonuclease Cas4 (RecB family)